MKVSVVAALIQFVMLFLVIGTICFLVKGDFFYIYLAPLCALVGGIFRFVIAFVLESFNPDKD